MEMMLRLAVAAVLAAAVGGGRFLAHAAVIRLVPDDAQNAIAVVFAALVSALVGLAVFVLAAFGLWATTRGAWSATAIVGVILAALFTFTAIDLRHAALLRRALVDAADPATGAERLAELARSPIGFGYEIDNRVASHPHTPPEVLRALHGRPDQIGTELCLAANPHTPDDILKALAARDDQWREPLALALRRNPRYHDVFPDQRSLIGAGTPP